MLPVSSKKLFVARMIINNTNASSLTASPLPHPHDKENIVIVYQPLAKDIAVSNVISFFPE